MAAVVIIISVLSALAIPGITRRMYDRRVTEAAKRVATLYRQARMRAMGRGSAVVLRFEGSAQRWSVLEAQRGSATIAACSAIPVSSCLGTAWPAMGTDLTTGGAASSFRLITQLSFGDRAEYQTGTGATTAPVATVTNSSGTAVPTVDFCFSPSGRAFVTNAGVLEPMSGAHSASFQRPIGRARRIIMLPNGFSRFL